MRFGVPVSAVLAGCLLLVGVGLVGGCAENRSSLFIAAAMYVDPTGSDCTVDASGDVTLISKGEIDLALLTSYTTPLLVVNQLVQRGNGNQLRTETSRIQIESADVTVTPTSGGEGTSYRIPVSGIVDAGDSEPGQSGIFMDLVPEGVITEEGDYILLVTLHGRTLGGTEIDSGEWSYPVHACTDNCLAFCPPEGAVDLVVTPCRSMVGNDYGVDCRVYDKKDDTSGPVCRSVCPS